MKLAKAREIEELPSVIFVCDKVSGSRCSQGDGVSNGELAREINESGPDVVGYGTVLSSLVSLVQPTAKAGVWRSFMRLMVVGTEERVMALQ